VPKQVWTNAMTMEGMDSTKKSHVSVAFHTIDVWHIGPSQGMSSMQHTQRNDSPTVVNTVRRHRDVGKKKMVVMLTVMTTMAARRTTMGRSKTTKTTMTATTMIRVFRCKEMQGGWRWKRWCSWDKWWLYWADSGQSGDEDVCGWQWKTGRPRTDL
jgi:hypothetical protein